MLIIVKNFRIVVKYRNKNNVVYIMLVWYFEYWDYWVKSVYNLYFFENLFFLILKLYYYVKMFIFLEIWVLKYMVWLLKLN